MTLSCWPRDRKAVAVSEQVEDDSTNIDELLEDDIDDSYEEKDAIKKIDSSLKIADDDFADVDDDN